MTDLEYQNYLLKKEKELLEQKDLLGYDKEQKELILKKIEKRVFLIEQTLLKIELEKEAYDKYKREELLVFLKNIGQVAGAGLFIDVPAHLFGDKLLSEGIIKGADILAGILVIAGTGFLTFDLRSVLHDFKKDKFITATKNETKQLKKDKIELMEKHESLEETIKMIRIKYFQIIAELDEIYDNIKDFEISGIVDESKVKTRKKEKRTSN